MVIFNWSLKLYGFCVLWGMLVISICELYRFVFLFLLFVKWGVNIDGKINNDLLVVLFVFSFVIRVIWINMELSGGIFFKFSENRLLFCFFKVKVCFLELCVIVFEICVEICFFFMVVLNLIIVVFLFCGKIKSFFMLYL